MADTLFEEPKAEIIPIPEKIPTISSSSMSTFKQCNLRWKFRYIDKLKDPAGGAAVLGTFVHSVLEELFKLPPEERTETNAKLIARIIWNQVVLGNRDFTALGLTDDAMLKFRKDSWMKIRGLWQLEEPESVEVVSTEEKFEVAINGYTLIGYIDRVNRTRNGKLAVVDYKSGKAPRRDYRQDKLDQVILYGFALRALLDEMPDVGMLYYIGKSSEMIRASFTEKKLDLMGETVIKATEDINAAKKADEWEATAGPLCAWCPYLNRCETGAESVRIRIQEGKKTPSEAKALLAAYDAELPVDPAEAPPVDEAPSTQTDLLAAQD